MQPVRRRPAALAATWPAAVVLLSRLAGAILLHQQPGAGAGQQQPASQMHQLQDQHQAALAELAAARDPDPLQHQAYPGLAGRGPAGVERDPTAGPIFRYHGMATNSSTVKLVWNLLNGYHADYFEIKYGPIPETEMFSVKLNGTNRDHTFHQLMPDTLYQFRLQGHHAEHAYKPQLVVVKTQPANYGAKSANDYTNRDIMPLGVKAEPKSNSSIQLSWIEPEKPANIRNSIRVNIIRYYVNPSSLAAANSNNNMADNGAANSSASSAAPQYHYLNVTNARESRLIVQRLKPATEYAFAVKTAYYTPDMKRIFTQSGFSMDTIAKTFDLEPSAPQNFTYQVIQPSKEEQLVGQTPKLELNWAPPESPNGQLKGYVILYSHDQNLADDKWLRIYVNDSNINNWYVANLRAGNSYYFKIRAINQRGQSVDSETRLYMAPAVPADKIINMPIPPNNKLMLIVICLVAILFVLFLVVSRLLCRTRRKQSRKGSLSHTNPSGKPATAMAANFSSGQSGGAPKLNGYAATNCSSTVTGRVGTLARRRGPGHEPAPGANGAKTDFWISAMEQQQEIKSNMSEKSNSDINMAAMVSIQRDSPHQFVTQTQLAPVLPEYRFAAGPQQMSAEQQKLLHQLQQHQQQGHYHTGQFAGGLAYDQMDNATASALMTLSKRQQQQLQKYQIQFAATGQAPSALGAQAPSPHQQPPPPPPLNIEQQQHQHQQPLYGSHQAVANTRSLRLHRPTLYDPVSGSFVQSSAPEQQHGGQPPNYNAHLHPLLGANNATLQLHGHNGHGLTGSSSSTLQLQQAHQTATLLSRRSTNTLRSFQSAANNGPGATYGQLAGGASFAGAPPGSLAAANQQQQPQQLLQSHQAVINQLNNSTYPSLPLKHVSAVRPQIMSSLEDQIEMELAEKEPQQQQQQQLQSQDQQQKAIKQ